MTDDPQTTRLRRSGEVRVLISRDALEHAFDVLRNYDDQIYKPEFQSVELRETVEAMRQALSDDPTIDNPPEHAD